MRRLKISLPFHYSVRREIRSRSILIIYCAILDTKGGISLKIHLPGVSIQVIRQIEICSPTIKIKSVDVLTFQALIGTFELLRALKNIDWSRLVRTPLLRISVYLCT